MVFCHIGIQNVPVVYADMYSCKLTDYQLLLHNALHSVQTTISVILVPAALITVAYIVGGESSWTESDAHHTLVLGPGDHVVARNTVSMLAVSVSMVYVHIVYI